jgi:mannosyl-oligosaccharide glucosidase
MTSELESADKSFKTRFANVFSPKAPFITDQHVAFSEAVFSDLLGGLGYFTGTSKVDTSKKAIYAETTANFWEKSKDTKKHATPETKGPHELLTHTPSRATFPRGFLWDEGFHLLPIIEWDADLALEVIRSWLALMDDDGWIAREQILGPEAESATPDDFIAQLPHIANPPTMFLVISKFIDMLKGTTKYHGHESLYLAKSETGKAFMVQLYPLLKKHYEWFRRSQSGDVEAHSIPPANLNEGYRWRGRTPESNYASGLDDYPRAEPPDITELHLDALLWVGVMARVLEQIAFFTENTHDAFNYQNHIRGVKTNLDTIHWEGEQNVYCDTVVRHDRHTYACHKGYISLFPLITGFVDASHQHLPFILDILHDPKHLWTDHGVRSLSPEDSKYGKEYNYWRSPIWVNINYLILTNLLTLAKTSGPSQARCRSIYIELRRNIVHTVFSSYLQTGYTWEQYDPVDGHGQRTQHFTGWTALVVKIMAMPDLENGEGVGETLKEYYEEAKKHAVQNQKTSAGSVVFAIVLMGFGYVTRRRFAGTLRSWRRN